jgi:hypothetical protein
MRRMDKTNIETSTIGAIQSKSPRGEEPELPGLQTEGIKTAR